MPKIETNDDSLELKIYLRSILEDKEIDVILEDIVDQDIDKLWKFVVSYKLLAHNLEKLRIKDVELAFLVGNFLGNYHAIEGLLKKYEEKHRYESDIEEVICKSINAVDILSDLFVAPAISEKGLLLKYKDDNIEDILKEMSNKKIITRFEGEKERLYMLTKNTRKYMKEIYYNNIEEEKEKDYEYDNMRSKALHLLRIENNKESE